MFDSYLFIYYYFGSDVEAVMNLSLCHSENAVKNPGDSSLRMTTDKK